MSRKGRQIAERLARNNRALGLGGRFFLAAVIISGGRILSSGMNIRHRHSSSCCHKNSVHAEEAAVKRAGDSTDATLYVCRVLHNGEMASSKPCPACMVLIKLSGVRKVCYTEENQWHSMAVG